MSLGPAAFNAALVAYRPNMLRFALSLTFNKENAEDLVSETTVRALANRKQFSGGEIDMHRWLNTILKNAWKTNWRKNKRIEFTDDPTYADSLTARDNPECSVDARKKLREIAKLKPKFSRQLFEIGVGMTIEQSAAEQNVPEGTIKSRRNRAQKYHRHLTLES